MPLASENATDNHGFTVVSTTFGRPGDDGTGAHRGRGEVTAPDEVLARERKAGK